jgi:hypothetical protein
MRSVLSGETLRLNQTAGNSNRLQALNCRPSRISRRPGSAKILMFYQCQPGEIPGDNGGAHSRRGGQLDLLADVCGLRHLLPLRLNDAAVTSWLVVHPARPVGEEGYSRQPSLFLNRQAARWAMSRSCGILTGNLQSRPGITAGNKTRMSLTLNPKQKHLLQICRVNSRFGIRALPAV